MTLNLGGWIHTFTVTDTQTHKGGYTIYKITSIVFPRAIPKALTCLVVWKRFHDVKRLYRELYKKHKNLQLPGKVPEPTSATYFKRFDTEVIETRKNYILQLLDFAAQYPALYKCHPFTSFFSNVNSPNESPLHRLHIEHSFQSTIGSNNKNEFHKSIENFEHPDNEKAVVLVKRNQEENEAFDKNAVEQSFCFVSLAAEGADEEEEMSIIEPESFTNKLDNQINSNLNFEDKINDDNQEVENGEEVEKQDNPAEVPLKAKEPSDPASNEDCKRPKRDFISLLTPMASIESDDSDYIYEAALKFSHAVEAEVNQDYAKAHAHYKQGVEILLQGCQEDSNDDRKFIAKTKIKKYSTKLEEINERFLKNVDEVDNVKSRKMKFQLSVEDENESTGSLALEQPWHHLSDYKVTNILNNCVMKVQNQLDDSKTMFIMKGIEKPSSNSLTQSIFLPQNVPYMTDLIAYFQSDEKVFLLLRYAEGGLLFDHIKNYCPSLEKRQGYADLFPEIMPLEESTDQYSSCVSVEDSGYAEASAGVEEAQEYSDIVRQSQELLQTVSQTLKKSKNAKASSQTVVDNQLQQQTMPEACLKQWICELAIAIHSLHAKGIILKDLHMENLLLGSKGQLLLTYFYQNEGPTFEDSYVHKAFNEKAVAGHFVAPERPLTFKSDWWSFGIVLYQLLTAVTFKAMHPGNIELYASVQYPEQLEISETARDLLEHLIEKNTEERFDFAQLQKHKFFNGINWKALKLKGYENKLDAHLGHISSHLQHNV